MKRFSSFPLFNSHLDLAHNYWATTLSSISPLNDHLIIDATSGNGHDSLFLAQISLLNTEHHNRLTILDKQPQAIAATKNLLSQNLPATSLAKIEYFTQCHSSFPHEIIPNSVSLLVYNLGYLPGGDKAITTSCNSTLKSLTNALPLIRPGGIISITCYPGHPEGAKEEMALLEFAATLPPTQWSCCHHRWLNRKASPSLLLIQKAIHPK